MRQISFKVVSPEHVTTFETTDPSTIWERLAQDLIAKKMHKCSYIRSIKDVNNYDGTRTITVYEDNGYKGVYTIPTH